MNWKSETDNPARRLRRNAFIGGGVALVILAIAPPTAGANGFTGPLAWWLLLAFCLSSLALSAHLLFDAALFRLAASHDTQEAGLAAIDDTLARMGLRPGDGAVRGLPQRLGGCRRLLWLQRLALVVALVLYAILLIDAESAAFLC